MNEIIWVPMSADKALKIIRSMYDSNRMVNVIITFKEMDVISIKWLVVLNDTMEKFYIVDPRNWCIFDSWWYDYLNHNPGHITIHEINQIIPTYSCGDRVLILSTGEIREVTKIRWDARDTPIELNNNTDQFYHWSQICKLPNDL